MTDAEMIERVKQGFASAQRPEHFTNFTHCRECQEHDDLLRSRELNTLTFEDVGNVGWNPISYATPEGFCYYFPALARIALVDPPYGFDSFLSQLLFHLTYHGAENKYLRSFSEAQRSAVAIFLSHVVSSHQARVTDSGCGDDLQIAIALWDAAQPAESG